MRRWSDYMEPMTGVQTATCESDNPNLGKATMTKQNAEESPSTESTATLDSTATPEVGTEAVASGVFDPRAYWDNRLSKDWTLHGVGLLAATSNWNEALYRVRGRVFSRVVAALEIDLAKASVLEVGPGTGFYLRRWKQHGVRDLSGLDIAASAVAQLSEKFPKVKMFCGDVSEDVSAVRAAHPHGFDVIAAFDVLFHVMDDEKYEQAFKNVESLLAPGGCFVFSEKLLHHRTQRRSNYVNRSIEQTTAAVLDAGLVPVRRLPMFYLMTYPSDAASPWQRKLHQRVVEPLARSQRWGAMAGKVLGAIDLAITALVVESPTTEIMICRKPGRRSSKPRRY
jgi:SAM-dependent methyltransferase